MTLGKRVLLEKRLLVIPLALGLLLNVIAYIAIVRPLGVKAAGVADRAATARRSVATAERDFANAQELVAGKTRADEELSTFYDKVLPADLSAARRLTFTSVPELARKHNVKFLDRHSDVEPEVRDTQVGRVKIRMGLSGDYESLRQFIFDLESGPEFVILDVVTLMQSDPEKPLSLALELSTYYKLAHHGT
jgi:Tfp pilus assembly protein PilO